jgi:hypothetical protein
MTKQNIFLLLALCLAGVVSAQTERGRFMLNLHSYAPSLAQSPTLFAPTNSLGFGSGTYSEKLGTNEYQIKYTNIGFNTSAHYFILDNLSVGAQVNLFNQKLDPDGLDAITNSLMALGPELRYYFPMGANAKIYLRGGAAFGNLKSTNLLNEQISGKLNQFGGGAGLAIFPSRAFSVNLGLGYQGQNIQYEKNSKLENNSGGVGFDVGFSVFFGGGSAE